MLLKSGKIVNSRPGPRNVVTKQDIFKKRGQKKLQIETETIEKLLEGLETLVDLLISRIKASEEVSLS